MKQLHKKIQKCAPKETNTTNEVFTTATCEFPNVSLPARKLVGQNENLWWCPSKKYRMCAGG